MLEAVDQDSRGHARVAQRAAVAARQGPIYGALAAVAGEPAAQQEERAVASIGVPGAIPLGERMELWRGVEGVEVERTLGIPQHTASGGTHEGAWMTTRARTRVDQPRPCSAASKPCVIGSVPLIITKSTSLHIYITHFGV